jgi:predicted glycoside hydrolase/deacetylase ChbG (UPF0249 family)
MAKELIITADDFGLGSGVNRAVADAFAANTLSSASLMTTAPGFEEAVNITRDSPGLDIGLHFVLAWGKPLSLASDIPSLLDRSGGFLPRYQLLVRGITGRLRHSDIARELEAQLSMLHDANIKPSFINGDQHVHILPIVRDVVVEAASRYGLALRIPAEQRIWRFGGARFMDWPKSIGRLLVKSALGVLNRGFAHRCSNMNIPSNDQFMSPFGVFPAADFSVGAFHDIFNRIRGGLTELMVHPSYYDSATSDFWIGGDKQTKDRESEIMSLLDPRFHAILKEKDLSLTTYGKVFGTP